MMYDMISNFAEKLQNHGYFFFFSQEWEFFITIKNSQKINSSNEIWKTIVISSCLKKIFMLFR